MLEDVLNSYRKKAEVIEWKKYNPNELFFKYIEHENDELAENYFAGIVCRYWGHSGRMYTRCNRHIPFEECYDSIIDSIKYVLEKRVWEDPSSSLYNDPTGPDKAMHVAMKRQQGIVLSKYNAHRRLSNFNTLSLDEAHENYNDSAEGLLFGNTRKDDDHLRLFISEYFNSGDYLDGLFLDTICYNMQEYKEATVLKHLKSISDYDFDYYINTYNVDHKKLKKTLYEIKNLSNNYLKVKLNSLLYKIKIGGLFND